MRQNSRKLTDFEGEWRLRKSIIQDGEADWEFRGTAGWRPHDNGLAYHEYGQLRLGGDKIVTAKRSYLWCPDLSVYFDDGRFFHKVPAEGGRTEHWCDPDLYDVTYDFGEWPEFRVEWSVTGPHKSYRMTCLYSDRRCPSKPVEPFKPIPQFVVKPFYGPEEEQ